MPPYSPNTGSGSPAPALPPILPPVSHQSLASSQNYAQKSAAAAYTPPAHATYSPAGIPPVASPAPSGGGSSGPTAAQRQAAAAQHVLAAHMAALRATEIHALIAAASGGKSPLTPQIGPADLLKGITASVPDVANLFSALGKGNTPVQPGQVAWDYKTGQWVSPKTGKPMNPRGASNAALVSKAFAAPSAPAPAKGGAAALVNAVTNHVGDIGKLFGYLNNTPKSKLVAGDINPFSAPGWTTSRTDQGVDASALKAGTPILAPNTLKSLGITDPNWYNGQPLATYQIVAGPEKGRFIFAAEGVGNIPAKGTTIQRGQPMATYAPHGSGVELGYAANASGTTLAKATTGYVEGQVTPAGLQFRHTFVDKGGSAANAQASSKATGLLTKAFTGQGLPAPAAQGQQPSAGGKVYAGIITSPSGLTVKGQALSSSQQADANRIIAYGRKIGASPAAIVTVLTEAIAENSLNIANGDNGTYFGLLAGSHANFPGTAQQVADAMIHAAYTGGKGFTAGGAIATSKSISDPLLAANKNAGAYTNGAPQFLGEAGHQSFAPEAAALLKAATGQGTIPAASGGGSSGGGTGSGSTSSGGTSSGGSSSGGSGGGGFNPVTGLTGQSNQAAQQKLINDNFMTSLINALLHDSMISTSGTFKANDLLSEILAAKNSSQAGVSPVSITGF